MSDFAKFWRCPYGRAVLGKCDPPPHLEPETQDQWKQLGERMRAPLPPPIDAYKPLNYRWGKRSPTTLAAALRKQAHRWRFSTDLPANAVRWYMIAAAEAIEEQQLAEIRQHGT